jgi:hypothetical protein
MESEKINEQLPQQASVDQLKNVKKIIDKEIGGDIGDKVSDLNKQGANIQYYRNPIETGIESFQDYEKDNKNFDPKHIFKRIKPFRNFINAPHRSETRKTKKEKKK